VRRFADRPIPQDLLDRIVDCARYSVSAGEDQPWRFVIVRDRMLRHRLSEVAFNSILVKTAPVVLAGCARVHSRISGHGKPAYPIDLAAAGQAMSLCAADLGLQTAWITGFREPALRALLTIPSDVPVVTLLAIGYPDGFDKLPARRPLSEVVSWDRWGEDT
jgi:nitroreductase